MNEQHENTTDLMKYVALGVEVEAFLVSPLGRYISERCEEDRQEALTGLGAVDPHDPAAVRALQLKVWRADQLMQWLLDAINNGQAAIMELKDQ